MSEQKPLKMLVSSCDAYADLWPYFFELLFKYYPDCPQPVYLITNKRRYLDHRVQCIHFEEDGGWAANLLESLKQLGEDYVLYVQDDYLMQAPVSTEKLIEWTEFLRTNNGAMLQLFGKGEVSREEQAGSTEELYHFSNECKWVTTLQAAIWDTRKLAEMVEPQWSPWDAESGINRKAKELGSGFYGIKPQMESAFRYTQGVKGGYWMPDGVALCNKEGFTLDLKHRPCLPMGNTFFKKLYRSVVKRRTELRRRNESEPVLEVRPLS